MKIYRLKLDENIYILLMALAFTGNHYIQLIVSTMIVGYAIVLKRKRWLSYHTCREMLSLFLMPCVVIHIYSLFIVIANHQNISLLSTNIFTYLPILVAIATCYLFGSAGCMFALAALILYFSTHVVFVVSKYGVASIKNALQSFLSMGGDITNVFELDDAVLASAYFIPVLIALNVEKTRRGKIRLTLGYLIIFILGSKRIAVLAVLATLLVHVLMKKISTIKGKIKFENMISWLIVILGIVFIYAAFNMEFINSLINKFSINVMARNYFWEGVLNKCSFSPIFFGYGRGSVKAMMYSMFPPYMNVHCDYIKMYAEIGFVPFIIWLYYYFIFLRKKLGKIFGFDTEYIFFLTMIVTAVLYLTDNTESYFICGLMRCLIPMSVATKIQENNKRKEII